MSVNKLLRTVPVGIASMLLITGCEVTEDKVSDARQNIAEERRETEEARSEGNQEIRQEQKELVDARHSAKRANYDEESMEDVREEQQDVEEARENMNEIVREEKNETNEAKQQAQRLERELEADKARDQFVANMEEELEAVDKRINRMQERLENLEGEAYERLETEIDALQAERDVFADAIVKVRDAEALNWEAHKSSVETALEDLRDR